MTSAERRSGLMPMPARVVIKEILFRAARRTETLMTLVANQPITVPRSPFIKTVQVASGFDVADNEIVKRLVAGDLVITADIPLAAEVDPKRRSRAESARRALYQRDHRRAPEHARLHGHDARQRYQHRRSARNQQGDRQDFANALDRFLAQSG